MQMVSRYMQLGTKSEYLFLRIICYDTFLNVCFELISMFKVEHIFLSFCACLCFFLLIFEVFYTKV
jgi:hypothetical protein